MAKMGKKLCCSPSTIKRLMDKHGIKSRILSEAAEEFFIPKQTLKKLYYQNKLSVELIGKLYGCSHATILNKMEFYGLKRRGHLGTRKPVIITKKTLINLYLKRKFSQNQIAKTMHCSVWAIEKLMKKYKIKSRGLSESQMIYPKFNFSGNPTERAYLIGFRLGDLNVERAKLQIQVRCSTTRPAQVQLIRDLFSKYTHLGIKNTRYINNQLITDIRCFLNKSFNFLLPKKDKIEPWILKNDKFFFAFVAGYTDAEGCLLIRKYKKSKIPVAGFELQSSDKNIINQIWKKIILFGIRAPRPKVNRPIGVINRKNIWRLSIFRKSSLLKFLGFIEPYLKHHDKKNKLYFLKKNIISRLK